MNGSPVPQPAIRRRPSTIWTLVSIFTISFIASFVTVRNWTDVEVALACAAIVSVGSRAISTRLMTLRVLTAGVGLFAGYLVLGVLVDVDEWSAVTWMLLGALVATELVVLVRVLVAMSADADMRSPSRRVLIFVGGTGTLAVIGGGLESMLLGAMNVRTTASALDLIFGTAIAATLAAIAVTRRGSEWLRNARPAGAELLGPLMVLLVTLVALQATRQVWTQRDDDRLDVLARSVHATLGSQWEREIDVLRARAQALAPVIAFDVSRFAELAGSYLVESDAAVGAALGTVDGTTSWSSIDSVDDGASSATVSDAMWSTGDSIVVDGNDDSFPLVVIRTDLVALPDGGDLVMAVAFSLPELVRSATADVIGRFDDVGVVLARTGGNSTAEVWTEEGVDSQAKQTPGGTLAFAGEELLVAVSPSDSFGTSTSTIAGVLGLEIALGLLLGGVLIFGANAEFKMNQERRRRENLLQAALDATPGSSVVFDKDFRVLAANRPVRQAFADEVPGLEVFRLFGLESGSGRRRLVEEVLRKALNGETGNIEIAEDTSGDLADTPSAPNRMRIIELAAYPVTSPGGEPIGFLHSVDATERRNLAMRSAQSERMESLGALAGGLAHDFNNLLFVTLGNLQLMAMNEAVVRDEKLSKFLSRSMSAVERGAEITKSLLAVARSQPLDEKSVSLGDLVKGILPLVRQALGSGRRVEVDIADPSLQLMLDPGRLSSCILNLAFNARDAMGPNGVLRIAARLDESTDMIELSVADDGAGMPEDVVARAFEPFFTTKSAGSGTGLGLATVYAFAQQSGGTAYLESSLGSGTTVTMVLPRFTGEPVTRGTVSERRSGRRVVVADDEQDLAEMVAAWLIDMGIDARFATSPKSALELIESFEPDVLVSDANFGEELDGIELARLGTAIVPDMAVVFMTGYSTSMRELQELGERTLAKPFSREDLHSALSPLIAEDTKNHKDSSASTTGRKRGRSS